jgi:hypothetical protein
MKIIKHLILLIFLTITSHSLLSQIKEESELDFQKNRLLKYQKAITEIDFLKKIYTNSDTSSHIIVLYKDSSFLSQLDTLNQSHPFEFYKKCGELLNKKEYDKASILFELAFRRYKYFNATNPNYQESNDGTLAMSLAYAIGEKITKYENVNFNNYINILQFCIDWHKTHPYQFNKQNSDTSLYDKITLSLIELKQKEIDNKNERLKKIAEEKADFLNTYDSFISELNKGIRLTKKAIKKLE